MERLKELFHRFKLYVFGVRFFEQINLDEAIFIKAAEYLIDEKHAITFRFYRIASRDLFMKQGRITSLPYYSYVVTATFGEGFPPYVKKYEDRRIVFNGRVNHLRRNEQAVLELLLDIYLDYLKAAFQREER